jgi:hypothetical protein
MPVGSRQPDVAKTQKDRQSNNGVLRPGISVKTRQAVVRAFSKSVISFDAGGRSKAAKNTGLSRKNVFFCEKTGLMFFCVFFALFSRAMCGAGTGVLGEILRLQRKISPIFSQFPPLSSSVPKVLGP